MIDVIFDVLVVSLTAGALAALLVLSERFIANYGPCEIDINGEKQFTVDGGMSLLNALVDQKIFIPSACGGRGTCGYCKLKVLEGAGPLLPTEEPFLDNQERSANVRLSCQVRLRNDIRIEIPADLLQVKEYTCRCADIVDLTHDMKQFRFELQDPRHIHYTPGQYIQLLTPTYGSVTEEVYRAYSISCDPCDRTCIETIIRLVPGGICTTYCFEHLEVGDEVKFNGPYGDLHLSDSDAPMIFVAGGSGMAPIKCLLHHMVNTNNPRKTVFFFGANGVDDLFLLDEMKGFESALPDFTFVPVVSRPAQDDAWTGETGLVTEALRRHYDQAVGHEAYLCGSPGMIDAVNEVLKDLGVEEDKTFFDKFA